MVPNMEILILLTLFLFVSHLIHFLNWLLGDWVTNSSQSQGCSMAFCWSSSLSWCQAPIWGPWPHFYRFVDVGCQLSWASPAQSFSGPSPIGLMTIWTSQTCKFLISCMTCQYLVHRRMWVLTSHMSINQHISVAMQRLVDFISMVTQQYVTMQQSVAMQRMTQLCSNQNGFSRSVWNL
jgi:hypothetical protein